MRLKQKLSLRSSLIFACTLGFVASGTYLLFRYHTNELYDKKLLDRARLAADFYLEKDELNERIYRDIESRYRKISSEPVRLYHAGDRSIHVKDSLDIIIPEYQLQTTANQGTHGFTLAGRRFAGLLYNDNQGDFIIVVSGIDNTGNAQLIALRRMLIIFCLLGLLLHYFLTGILAKKTFRPFANLISKVNSIKADNLHTRLELPNGRPDEMKDLMATFNDFLERLDHSMKIQRNFLKNASHELKTPLAVLIGDIEVTLNHPRKNEEYQALLGSLRKEALHLKAIVEGLLTLSSLEMPARRRLKPVRIDEVLWEVIGKKQIEYPGSVVSVDLDAIRDREELLTVKGNRELLFISLSNVVDNALKFSGPETITIAASVVNGQLVIGIGDRGPGIPEADRERLFELFYRGSSSNHIRGHGIGLYLTKQILNLHNIGLELHSAPTTGTTINFLFPA